MRDSVHKALITLNLDRKWILRELRRAIPGKRGVACAGGSPRVLLLASSFPPTFNAGVYRPLSWVRRGAARGVAFSVVTFEPPRDEQRVSPDLTDRIPRGTRVQWVSRATNPGHWRLSREFHDFIGSALAFFEAGARIMREEPVDVIVATGPDFFSFLAGTWLSEQRGVPVILDYRDEWVLSPNPGIPNTVMMRYFERRSAHRASRILNATQSYIDDFVKVFPHVNRKKLMVLPNGWDREEWEGMDKTQHALGDQVDLTFFGELGHHTGGAALVQAFEDVLGSRPDLERRVTITFVGWVVPEIRDYVERSAFRNRISLLEPWTKAESIRGMTRSDILLLALDEGYLRSIPGKAYEYLASGRPILYLGAAGEMATLLEALRAGIVVEGFDRYGLETALDTMLATDAQEWNTAERREWVRTHERSLLADEFIGIVEELAGKSTIAQSRATLDR